MLSAGLPNITGQFQGGDHNDSIATGAFYFIEDTNSTIGGNVAQLDRIGLDASRSSSIYGASNTVQPPALSLLPQIKY